jgi:thiamine biosynthesis lipoprotein
MIATRDMRFSVRPAEEVVGSVFGGFGTVVGVWTTQPALLPELDSFLRGWVETVEAAASRFREESDISRVNLATGTTVKVSADLLDAVDAACLMADATYGLCDPTVGIAVISAGYDRSFEHVTTDGPGPEIPHNRGGAWKQVEIDHVRGTLLVPAGYQLDLGGSAKGWAVDQAIARMRHGTLAANPGAGVCVSAGGDMAVTGVPPRGGWPVTIRERLDGAEGVPERQVQLVSGAMATSGATARRWQRDGSTQHHIIDPRTGRPGTSTWTLVTTFSDSCLVADTMATAAWLLNQPAPLWLAGRGVGARLLRDDGSETLVGDLTRWLAGVV